MAKEFRLVRIKPYNKKSGHVLRSYTYQGMKFQVERGWYKVDLEMAEYLAEVRSEPENETSPMGFDVCTEAEAKALDKREYDAKVRNGQIDPEHAPRVQAPRDVTAGAKADPTRKPEPVRIEGGDLQPEDLAEGTSRARKGTGRGRSMRAAPEGA